MNIDIESIKFGINDRGFNYHNHTELLSMKITFEEAEAIRKSLAKIDEEHGLIDFFDPDNGEYEMGIEGLEEFLKDVNIPRLNLVLEGPEYGDTYSIHLYSD